MQTQTRINAIPTMYKGIQMRSRLEAQWARVFDELGIPWVYEPEGMELSANGESWIPDFAIKSVDGKLILVEIKPLTALPLSLDDLFNEHPSLAKVHKIAKAVNTSVVVLGSELCFSWRTDNVPVRSMTRVGVTLGGINLPWTVIQISSSLKGWHDVELSCKYSLQDMAHGLCSGIEVGYCAFEREGKKQRKNDQLDFTEVWDYCKNELQWRKPA